MKKRICVLLFCAAFAGAPLCVSADVLNYEATMNIYKQDNKVPQTFEIEDGAGNRVTAVAKEDALYVIAKEAIIHSAPGENAGELQTVSLGAGLERVAVCDNGWSKVSYTDADEKKISGYVQDSVLTDVDFLKEFTDTVTVETDSDILDYPGLRDGEVVGEALQMDELTRTGTVNDVWSVIHYSDAQGIMREGYVLTSCLAGQEKLPETDTQTTAGSNEIDETVGAGVLSKSSGTGIFAEAVDGVDDLGTTMVNGVQEGKAVAASSDASLKPLGQFRITHYCQCSICCGPWANGITSTGVTATTNRTIAVDPTQIPYGSQVVINGQVYVAEDCGGAIKKNCIDIYVASHAEGEAKGVYYTDVYLVQ